jgi:hypothetical protein
MKRILLIAILVISTSIVFSQNFEGYILYSYQFLDSEGNDITKTMGPERGLEQNYYINSRNYKGIDEKGRLSQLYNSKTNTYFYQQGKSIKSFPGSTEYPKEFKYESQNDTLTIAGFHCKSIVVITESGKTTYYFSDSISVDSKNFMNQRFGNWSNYLKASKGALPLKFIVKQENYTLIATAIIIEQKKLDDSEFDIDKILKIKK